jgi:hypothetical protein
LLIGFFLLPAMASAQRIVLLRPKTADPALLQAFGRLQGELSVHQFEVIVVEANDDDPSPRALAKVAEQASAVAAVSLLRSEGLASADVWISDRVTGKTSMRTIATAQRSEAPSVLAIRAVDLLRASLREYPAGESPPPEVVGANPQRAPEHVRDWARSEPARHASVEASFVLQSTLSRLGTGFGPGVALGFKPSERLHVQAVFQGPLSGAGASGGGASLSLRQEQLFAQASYRLFGNARLAFEALAALGAHELHVQGDAAPPFAGHSESAWTALAAPGLGAEFGLTQSASLVIAGRAVFLAPRPVVHAALREYPYGRPTLDLSAGLRVWF